MTYDYDIIIIGGGAAGLVAAKVARGFGKRVLIIENNQLGGTCTMTGCIPSKTLIHIAKLIHESKKAAAYGETSSSKLDTVKIMERVRATREDIAEGHSPEALKKLGIDILFGDALFINPYHLQFNPHAQKNTASTRTLSAKKFIIATGTRPFIPDLPGLSEVSYLTNESFFTLEKLPESLLILGGGPVGIELAAALQRLGTSCTIIERNPTILFRDDHEMVSLVTEMLINEGVTLHTGTAAVSVTATKEENAQSVTLTCKDSAGKEINFTAERVLIAVGRKANIEHLDLEKAGVRIDQKGIRVNSYLQTTAGHIYACGDVVGPYQFSPMAEYQASIATRNACIPIFKKSVDYNQRTWITFTDPELAVMGLTEKEALAQYPNDVVIHRSAYRDYDRPRIDSTTEGMAKVVCKKNGTIIGAHIFGARAGELIAQLNLGAYYKLKLQDLYKPIQPYPTYSDVIWQLAKKAYVSSLKNNPFLRLIQKIASLLAVTKK